MDPTEKKKIISQPHKAKSLANKSFVSGIPEIKHKQNLKPKAQLNSQPQNSGLAIAGMVTGIVSLLFICIPFLSIIGFILGIIGIILSGIAIGQINKGQASGKGMAVAGLVTSIIALVISCFAVIGLYTFLGTMSAGI